MKRTACILAALLLVLPLSGCWNYRGLNQLTIVAGAAIDKDTETGNYVMTYETIDLTKPTQQVGLQAKIVMSEGSTLFDMTRDAKRQLMNKLYFGNMQILVVSKQIAQEGGLGDITDFLLRDAEMRETIDILISQQDTAREILMQEGAVTNVISYEIRKIIQDDHQVTGSTVSGMLFGLFNDMKGQGISPVLPAFHILESGDKKIAQANGIAAFHGDKLAGFLTAREAKYYLLVTNHLHGGVLTFPITGGEGGVVTLEIKESKAKISHSYRNKKLKITINTELKGYLDESTGTINGLDEKKIAQVEAAAQETIKQGVTAVVRKAQTQFGADIFGFGNGIYKTDFGLWKQLRGDWEKLFPQLEVEVVPKVEVVNTAMLRTN